MHCEANETSFFPDIPSQLEYWCWLASFLHTAKSQWVTWARHLDIFSVYLGVWEVVPHFCSWQVTQEHSACTVTKTVYADEQWGYEFERWFGMCILKAIISNTKGKSVLTIFHIPPFPRSQLDGSGFYVDYKIYRINILLWTYGVTILSKFCSLVTHQSQ